MGRSVQIPEELFIRLCYYHLIEETDDGRRAIIEGLEQKLDAMKRRELYGKAAHGDEVSRKKYLDMVGMSDSFRW